MPGEFGRRPPDYVDEGAGESAEVKYGQKSRQERSMEPMGERGALFQLYDVLKQQQAQLEGQSSDAGNLPTREERTKRKDELMKLRGAIGRRIKEVLDAIKALEK